MGRGKQSPIFVKTYDFLIWLLGRTARFPKNERFRLARRLEESAFAFYDLLFQAGRLPTEQWRGKRQLLVCAAHGDTWGLRRSVLGTIVVLCLCHTGVAYETRDCLHLCPRGRSAWENRPSGSVRGLMGDWQSYVRRETAE